MPSPYHAFQSRAVPSSDAVTISRSGLYARSISRPLCPASTGPIGRYAARASALMGFRGDWTHDWPEQGSSQPESSGTACKAVRSASRLLPRSVA